MRQKEFNKLARQVGLVSRPHHLDRHNVFQSLSCEKQM
jgi:hypothetical protein